MIERYEKYIITNTNKCFLLNHAREWTFEMPLLQTKNSYCSNYEFFNVYLYNSFYNKH